MTPAALEERLDVLPHASTSELMEMVESALESPNRWFEDRPSAKRFKQVLDALHAKLRRHHATELLADDPEQPSAIMNSTDPQAARLNAEHSTLLGLLGRLCEQCYTVATFTAHEQELFVLRLREFLAIFRRHKAEEDLRYYQTVWREVGGEG